MPYSDLVTQKEAAAILNRSVSAVSRAIKDGRLEYADPKNRLLHRPGLEMRFARKTRPRIDKPQRKTQIESVPHRLDPPGVQPEPIATTYWERLDQKLQWVLEGGPAYWQEPPNPQRLRLFVRSLDELRSQVELEGLTPH
jgi:hypothetical protein